MPPATGFVRATPKLAAERLIQQAKEVGYAGDDLPPYAEEKTFATADDIMLCMDAATGKTLWKAVVKDRAVNSQHHKVGPFDLSPAYANGRVFALSTSGWLYAFDAMRRRVRQPLGQGNAVRQALPHARGILQRRLETGLRKVN